MFFLTSFFVLLPSQKVDERWSGSQQEAVLGRPMEESGGNNSRLACRRCASLCGDATRAGGIL